MRRLLPLALLLGAATAVQAATVQRITPKETTLSLRLNDRLASEFEILNPGGSPAAFPTSPQKAVTTLNCENDNLLNPSSTLIIDAGDLAGSFFTVPATPTPYRITAVRLGVFSFNAAVPSQLDLVVLEDDGTGDSFNSIAGFTVDLDTAIDSAGEIVDVDLSSFDVTGENDLLILYGDAAGADNALVLPGGDSSARCLVSGGGTDNVCSVHLPAGETDLFIYGVIDGTECPSAPSQILNLDLVVEVDIAPLQVATFTASFGAVKARF